MIWPFNELKRIRAEHAILLNQLKQSTNALVRLRQENKELHTRLRQAQNPPVRLQKPPGQEQITKAQVAHAHLLRAQQNLPNHPPPGLRDVNNDTVKFADSMAGLLHPLEPGEEQ